MENAEATGHDGAVSSMNLPTHTHTHTHGIAGERYRRAEFRLAKLFVVIKEKGVAAEKPLLPGVVYTKIDIPFRSAETRTAMQI